MYTTKAVLLLCYAMYTYRSARWLQTVATVKVHPRAYQAYLILLISAQILAYWKSRRTTILALLSCVT